MIYFFQGLAIGFAYVAPIGLQNLFVINTALTQPMRRVYATELIVIFFDVTLALACFWGVGAIMSAAKWLEMTILCLGSLIVIGIGVSLVRAKDSMSDAADVNIPLFKVVSSACVLTWFNPQALIDGSMMLGASRAALPEGESLSFILGITSASILWFLGVSTGISIFKSKITNKMLRVINITCGLVIIFYGLKLGISFVSMLK